MTAEGLKAFCKERNLTYKELAEKMGYGRCYKKQDAQQTPTLMEILRR